MLAAPENELQARAEALAALVRDGDVCVLTGAGCSTESGIPDYRGPETRRRARNPIRMDAFLRDAHTRRRYWARSFLGWPRLQRARPNAGHRALAQLEEAGLLAGLITQNVDSLHRAAGSTQVVELHGALRQVVCLDCGQRAPRHTLQVRMQRDNVGLEGELTRLAPDGDADVEDAWVERFRPPQCAGCRQGVLKPDVVFFGENVPKPRVELAFGMLQRARSLLVVGSSLAVFSGYRFVRQAHRDHKPVAIVNLGETRGDAVATLCVQAPAGPTLEALAARLTLERTRPA